MTNHYNNFHQTLGFKRKEGLTKIKHLKENGYYNCQVFYNFLVMSRQRNPQKMPNWAIIPPGQIMVEDVNRQATYLGASSCTRTFIRTVKLHADSMIYNITHKLSSMQKSMWMLDKEY